jgi:MinD-like ATPase involved in chromosome partitioning or flagellar assembly
VTKLRLLLAVGHAEMHRFIAQSYGVEISDIAESAEELYELLNYSKADTLVLSRYLVGSENPQILIDRIKALRSELRIIYLYGVEDSNTKLFLKYLEGKNIIDYHVGEHVSSLDLNRLLFNNKKQKRTITNGFIKTNAKTLWVKELDKAVISIYSNCSNGKSHLAWNLSTAFARRGYKTTLLNLDRGYSANLYFGIEEIYFDLLEYLIKQGEHQHILDQCYKKGNLSVVTGNLGSDSLITSEDFLKLLYFTRSKSDILIIDTYTGLNDVTFQAINNSNIDLLIFDNDLMHFHMNKLMIEKLGGHFIAEKTYAIMNNCSSGSESYHYIYKQISRLNIKFKGLLPLSTCGNLGCDLMHTGKTPYETVKNSSFSMDLNNILSALNARNRKGTPNYIMNREEA